MRSVSLESPEPENIVRRILAYIIISASGGPQVAILIIWHAKFEFYENRRGNRLSVVMSDLFAYYRI